jgi:hypothetical protein
MVCAAASWRLQRRASQRSGGRIGRIVPRSGQVPTTTAAPAARNSHTASASRRTATSALIRVVTSFAPIMMIARSVPRSSTSST